MLPALAHRKKGGRAGLARAGVAAGCGVCGAVVSVGGAGRGGVLPVWAGVRVCCPVCCARCGVSGGGGALDRHRYRARLPLRVGVRWCGGVSCYLVSYYEEVVRMSRGCCKGTEAGEPGAGKRGAGGGLSPAGMAWVPWGPVGAEAPHVGWVRNHGLYFRY